jgi:hypothetical protein
VSPAVILRTEENKDAAIRRIKAIKPDQERPLAVFIGPYKKIRSLEQNSLYYKLLGMVSDATGHDRDTLHIYFKRQAFGARMESINGQMVEVVQSSAKASKGDFSALIEYVQAFIAEHNIEESA